MHKRIAPAPVRKSIRVPASSDRAFQVFTAGMGRWWPKSHHIGVADLETLIIEPHAGGRWVERGVDGSECQIGKVLVWEPPTRLVLGWQLTADWRFDPTVISEVEVRFTPDGANFTKVDLEHRDIERLGERAAALREQVDSPEGWSGLLQLFAKAVEIEGTKAMSEIIVYGVPGSPFLRSVQVGLEEKHAPYRFQAISPQEAKSEPYLKRHPFGRVPAFTHGDFNLYETQAILRYLDDLYPEPALEPRDLRAKARMNQIIGINDWYFFPKVAAVIVGQRIIGPALLGTPTDEAAIAAAVPLGRTCITELNRLLGSNRFFVGDELSIADVMLAPQIDFFAATSEGRALLAGIPLMDWLNRMNARPSMAATLRPEPLRGAA